MNVAFPSVAVVVCTRSRGDSVVATVESILSNDYPDFHLLVLDQSNDDRTEAALLPFRSDSRVTYVHSVTRGLGAAHNAAIHRLYAEFIAITDDDCIVPLDWLSEIVKAFRSDAPIGMVFGRVVACQYDTRTGYVPIFERNEPAMLRDVSEDLFQGLGIGACCAVRRSAWQSVCGFDEMLGPGAPLGSLEDRDMAIRLLLAGYAVLYTPRIIVTHYGFRTRRELRGLAFRDWFGFGACCAKYLKCGHVMLATYMVRQMWIGQALGQALVCLQVERRVGRITPVLAFWVGFIAGLASTVDHSTRLFTGQAVIGVCIGRCSSRDRVAARGNAHSSWSADCHQQED